MIELYRALKEIMHLGLLQRWTPVVLLAASPSSRRGARVDLSVAAPSSGSEWAAACGDIRGAEAGARYFEFFESLAADSEFAARTWAREPALFREVPGVAGSFTLEQLQVAVDSDFLDAGRGVPDLDAPGGWKMAPVSQPRGSSFEDAKMRYVDVERALTQGTVVFNSAGAHIPALGTMCLAALDAFGLPNCLNLYVTAKGTATSAPPHTDKQDVFVLQSCGAKRWRVYEPPPPARKPDADPLARGKAHDSLELAELAEPLLDIVLRPGEVLYVPAGFPHTTDTVNTAEAGDDAATDSVHLTIGVDTHIWGLDYLAMRSGALIREGALDDELRATSLGAEEYWALMGIPRRLGFLARHAGGADAAADADAAELARCARRAEPGRWEACDDDAAVATALGAAAVVEQAAAHAERVLSVQREMYLDAAFDRRPSAPGMPRVSIFRVQEHMAKLEAVMEDHLQWYGPEAARRVAAAAAAPPPTTAKAKTSSGFGGGGGGGGGAKTKAKAKGAKAKGKGKGKRR